MDELVDNTAIIILNYNTWEDTLAEVKLIDELFNISMKSVYIIDNASENGAFEQLQKRIDKDVHIIQAEENRGYAAGNNIGIRKAREDGFRYGWILNNDIVISDKQLLHKMLYVLQKDEKVAIVNPDIYAPDGHMFNRDSIRPEFWDLTLGIFHYKKKGRIVNNLGGYGYIYRPQGCCMLMDLKKIEEAGDFDEHTFLYEEEMILAERLLKKNYLCALCLDGKIIHNHSTTTKKYFTKQKIHKMKQDNFGYYLREYRGFSRLKSVIANWFYGLKLFLLEL